MIWAIFIAAVCFVAYVLVVYPVAIALYSRIRARPRMKRFEPRSVSVILPVRNGERWIEAKLNTILALDYPGDLLEVIVVLDGCTDRSEAIARTFSDWRVHVISQPASGKPTAVNTALSIAQGEVLFFTDVRQRLEPNSLRELVASFAEPSVGVVSGELVIQENGATVEEMAVSRYWKYEKSIRISLSAVSSFPGATGCIYAVRRELAVPMPPNMLVDDMYQPLNALFNGYRVIFEPGAKAYDYPMTLGAEFRRKVRTLAGVYQVMRYYPRLLNPLANPIWIHFVSHKLARLFLPYAFIVLFLSSLFLPDPWRTTALAVQGFFYMLAALDPMIPKWVPLKPLSSLSRTFVVLLAAAVAAVKIFFAPTQTLWKETRVRAAAP